jgi:nicotinamide riboside kinase
MSILVGFDGASGGGKTTLVKALAEDLEKHGLRVGIVHEVVRKVFKEYQNRYGFKDLKEIRNSNMILEFQQKCMVEQYLEEEYQLNKDYDVVLSDRTLFGNEFFTLFYQNGNFWALNRYFEKLKEYLKVRILTRGRIYDLVIITPPLKGIDVDDGFRTYDLNYREVQTFVISQLARAYVDNVVELRVQDLRERIMICRYEIFKLLISNQSALISY